MWKPTQLLRVELGLEPSGIPGSAGVEGMHYCQEQLAAAPGVGPGVPQSSCSCIVSPAQRTPITSSGFTCEELSSGKAEWKFRGCGFKSKFHHVNHKQKLTRYSASKKDLFGKKKVLHSGRWSHSEPHASSETKKYLLLEGRGSEGRAVMTMEFVKLYPFPWDRHRVFQFLPWVMSLS